MSKFRSLVPVVLSSLWRAAAVLPTQTLTHAVLIDAPANDREVLSPPQSPQVSSRLVSATWNSIWKKKINKEEERKEGKEGRINKAPTISLESSLFQSILYIVCISG